MTIHVTLITHAAMEPVAEEAVIVVMAIPTAALGVCPTVMQRHNAVRMPQLTTQHVLSTYVAVNMDL